MDRSIPMYQRMLIRMNLMMCKYCARFKKQLLLLRKFSRISEPASDDFDSTISLSAESKARLRNAIKSAMP